MKGIRITILLIAVFINTSCTEEKRVFMEMNKHDYPPDVLLEKAQYFIDKRGYYDAYHTIIYRAVPLYWKEKNVEGIRKSNKLLCQIYQTKEPGQINPYYSLEAAQLACKKAGIKMEK